MSTDKKTVVLVGALCFFVGVTLGFMIAPIKKGISITCGNNNILSREKKS